MEPIRESKHVFIEAGLKSLTLAEAAKLNIFEMGFGTGLNALLTVIEAENLQRDIHYETVEQFPLDSNETRTLNYCKQLGREDLQPIFEQLHSCEWEKKTNITANFCLKKSKSNLLNFETPETACPAGRHSNLFISMLLLQTPNLNYGQKKFLKKCLQCSGREGSL